MESSVTNTTRVTLFLGAGLAVIGIGLWIRSADAPPAPRAGSESNPSALDDDPALQIEQLRELERELARAAGSAPIPARGVPSAPLASAASSAEAPPSPLDDERFLDRSVDTLMARLSSDDDHLVLDAADGLRARKAVQAIPKLASIDVVKRPDAARSVIDALGQLAGMADPANRKVATDRLLELLAQEKARTEPDAPGNVLQIYEALGDTADPRAATALEQELADPRVPIAALAVVTAAIVKLRQPTSLPALTAARARVAGLAFDDAFMTQVQQEVVAAMSSAIEALSAR